MSASPPEPAGRPGAVFLSYASQDSGVARLIYEALCAEGVEVWFDENGLRGGEAWDRSIRKQIQECALFIPIVSAHSQARREGYFRLEWRLADERNRMLAEGTPFILPVAVDGIKERDALVPQSFCEVQWCSLPYREVPPAFLTRVKHLLVIRSGKENAGAPAGSSVAIPPAGDRRPRIPWRRGLSYGVPLVLVAAVGSWLALHRGGDAPGPPPPIASASSGLVCATIELPAEAPLAPTSAHPLGIGAPVLALSPDGSRLVYTALVGTTTQLYQRLLSEPMARPIPGTEQGCRPFFSPDGRWIAFLARSKLMKISVLGGTPITLCEASDEIYGAVWTDDNRITFVSRGRPWRVSAQGGTAEVIAGWSASESLRITGPDFGNGHFLGYVADGTASASHEYRPIQRIDLVRNQRTRLVERGFGASQLRSGVLVFARGASLFALAYQPGQSPVGEAMPVAESVLTDAIHGFAQYAVADNGTLVYAVGGPLEQATPAWVDRQGRMQLLPLKAQAYGEPKLSPDGRQLAISVLDVQDNIWIFDVQNGRGAPLTEPGINRSPRWSTDGRHLFFVSVRGTDKGVYVKTLDGVDRPAQQVYQVPSVRSYLYLHSCSPADGTLLLATREDGDARVKLISVAADGSRPQESRILPPDSFWPSFVQFSPDGRWISYRASRAGPSEIYLQRLADNRRIQVSFTGGEEPIWSAKGDELIFRYGDVWFAAPVTLGQDPAVGQPREICRGPYLNIPGFSYDVAPDGERLLVLLPKYQETPVTRLQLVLSWTQEVHRRLGQKGR